MNKDVKTGILTIIAIIVYFIGVKALGYDYITIISIVIVIAGMFRKSSRLEYIDFKKKLKSMKPIDLMLMSVIMMVVTMVYMLTPIGFISGVIDDELKGENNDK